MQDRNQSNVWLGLVPGRLSLPSTHAATILTSFPIAFVAFAGQVAQASIEF
jgi:hypothetical protein